MLAIKDIGNVVALSIYNWFRSSYNQKLLKRFANAGLKILKQESFQKSNKLAGKTFVFTGTLEHLTREQAEELAHQHGGNTSSSVSKETTHVVAGEESGSKYDQAKKLGVKIVDEKSFLDMVK